MKKSYRFPLVMMALFGSVVGGCKKDESTGGESPKNIAESPSALTSAKPASSEAAAPRPHAREGVNIAGQYTFTVQSEGSPMEGTVSLRKQGDERYVGTAQIGKKKLGVVARRDGSSLVGVFNAKHAGTWVSQYNIFCDHSLEGATVDQVTQSIGLEFLTGGTASLEASYSFKAARGFDGRFKGNLDLAKEGEALRAKARRTDEYSAKGLGVRHGDVLAVAYAFNGGEYYVFNLLLDEGPLGGFSGRVASESLKPALAASMTWTKTGATSSPTAPARRADACISVPSSGHEIEKLLAPKAAAPVAGGGATAGEDCSKYVGHYARCGYSTCQVNLDNDSQHCGACGVSCGIGTTCRSGRCETL